MIPIQILIYGIFDLGFNWEFAPGSKATLLYRNNIFNEDNMSGISIIPVLKIYLKNQ